MLSGEGIRNAQLARLRAPVGLDIGAASPEKIAIFIAAAIIAVRDGRRGGALRDGTVALHGPCVPPEREALRSA